ncbi:MAG: HEAT repeat domain-containing protein [Candidatus Saganbacteria bacterium]|nr:HEAT repeat domain-containing protein [Candidatus Saganbacteria bacterium]
MGLWCNGVEDSTKKLQLDFFGSRQRLFKHLGLNDRNNNGVIEAKEKNPLNKLIKAEEGYGSFLKIHPADLNQDRKIDEKEAWIYFAQIKLPLTSDRFLFNELKGKSFGDQSKLLNKIVGYLKKHPILLEKFFAKVIQAALENKKDRLELISYVLNFIKRHSKDSRGIPPLSYNIGKHIKGLEKKSAQAIFKHILHNKVFKPLLRNTDHVTQQYSFQQTRIIGGIFGKKMAKSLFADFRKSSSPIIRFNVIMTLILLKSCDSEHEIKQLFQELKTLLLAIPNSSLLPTFCNYIREHGASHSSALFRSLLKKGPGKIRHEAAKALLIMRIFENAAEENKLKAYVLIYEKKFDELAKLGEAAIDESAYCLFNEKDRLIRIKAANVLASIKTNRAIAVLSNALSKEHDLYVKSEMVSALFKINTEQALRVLSKFLSEEKNQGLLDKVAEKIAGIIEVSNDPRHIPMLMTIITNPNLTISHSTAVNILSSKLVVDKGKLLKRFPDLENRLDLFFTGGDRLIIKEELKTARIKNQKLRSFIESQVQTRQVARNLIIDLLKKPKTAKMLFPHINVSDPAVIKVLEKITFNKWDWETKPDQEELKDIRAKAAGLLLKLIKEPKKRIRLIKYPIVKVRIRAILDIGNSATERDCKYFATRFRIEKNPAVKRALLLTLARAKASKIIKKLIKTNPETEQELRNLIFKNQDNFYLDKEIFLYLINSFLNINIKHIQLPNESFSETAYAKDAGGDGAAKNTPAIFDIIFPKSLPAKRNISGILIKYKHRYSARTHNSYAHGEFSLSNGLRVRMKFKYSGQKTIFLACKRLPQKLKLEVRQGDHIATISIDDVKIVYSQGQGEK